MYNGGMRPYWKWGSDLVARYPRESRIVGYLAAGLVLGWFIGAWQPVGDPAQDPRQFHYWLYMVLIAGGFASLELCWWELKNRRPRRISRWGSYAVLGALLCGAPSLLGHFPGIFSPAHPSGYGGLLTVVSLMLTASVLLLITVSLWPPPEVPEAPPEEAGYEPLPELSLKPLTRKRPPRDPRVN
jgi:hypothetical protein